MPSLRARILNRVLRATTKSMWKPDLQITDLRRHMARMEGRLARGPLHMQTEAVSLDGVPATWFGGPEREHTGTLLYLHGGAWAVHLPRIYARLAATLSHLTGMRVLLPDYRLAPEDPFPAGVDDCFTAYRWLIDRGYRGRPLALAGDSAGGNLSLITLMRARDAMLALPDCAALLSPATDLTFSGASMRYNATLDPMFSASSTEQLPDLYCPGQDRRNPLLSPLFGNWQGLPPLLFHAGSTEMLLDDSIRAQDRARQAGVEADIDVYVALPHVWHVISWLPEAKRATRQLAEFILQKSVHRHG